MLTLDSEIILLHSTLGNEPEGFHEMVKNT